MQRNLPQITTVEVEDNQTVRVGDVLFRIDDRDYRAKLAQAMANVEAAKARVRTAATAEHAKAARVSKPSRHNCRQRIKNDRAAKRSVVSL